jgi:hypothetical protein
MPSQDIQIAKQGIHRQYEIMGMLAMELLQNRLPAGPIEANFLEPGGRFERRPQARTPRAE